MLWLLCCLPVVTGCIREEEYANDPVGNFEQLWKIIDERYCFLEEKGIDWDAVHDKYGKLVKPGISDDDLFDILSQMLYELKDGHVNLSSSSRISYYDAWYQGYPWNYREDILYNYYLGSASSGYRTSAGLKYKIFDNNIGYINLSTFSGNPSKEFKQAFLDLKKRGMTSLVIDLRNNGGGLLDESIEIANFFLPRGKTLVTTKGKIKQASNTYKTLREPLDLEIPLAVLVNGGTASSSEILAGSLQDLDRAVIIGNRTFGKGLVQTTRPLPYGGTMKLTTSKYYIPSGRCVQALSLIHI